MNPFFFVWCLNKREQQIEKLHRVFVVFGI